MPPLPVITGPDGAVKEGERVVLICTSPDSRPIQWSLEDSNITLMSPVFLIEGEFGFSNLTIENIQVMYKGVYVCQVGRTNSTFNLDVLAPASKSSPVS